MTEPEAVPPTDQEMAFARLRQHLLRTGWTLADQDDKTALWRLSREDQGGRNQPLAVVLPTRPEVSDWRERWLQAVEAIAYGERRAVLELTTDLGVDGGADTLAVRLSPEGVPSGSAPLSLVQQTVTALRDFVVGSASALEIAGLVLPSRRPQRAELYAGQALISTAAGSFIVNVALPLLDVTGSALQGGVDPIDGVQPPLLNVAPQPYGRRVTSRMLAVAERAVALADLVGAGERPLRAFAETNAGAANATELSALATLGGEENDRYQLRFTQSPETPEPPRPRLLVVTPAQQRTMAEAATYLREKQPRPHVAVTGLVVRLARNGNFGPGRIVVQALTDDSGKPRQLQIELNEEDYNDAVAAHRDGLLVHGTGDLVFTGTRTTMRNLSGFGVLPGIPE